MGIRSLVFELVSTPRSIRWQGKRSNNSELRAIPGDYDSRAVRWRPFAAESADKMEVRRTPLCRRDAFIRRSAAKRHWGFSDGKANLDPDVGAGERRYLFYCACPVLPDCRRLEVA